MIDVMAAFQDWVRQNELPLDGVALVVMTPDIVVQDRVGRAIARDLQERVADGRQGRVPFLRGNLIGTPLLVSVAPTDPMAQWRIPGPPRGLALLDGVSRPLAPPL